MRVWVILVFLAGARAQHDEHMPGNAGGALLMQQASGTSENPASSPMHMRHYMHGSWMFMLHGEAFLTGVFETGPRGDSAFASMNWLMGSAEHPLAGGTFLFRSMLSLEPATVTNRRYPELFQTGETAYGRPIGDGQHPHDFFMELAFEYVHPLGDRTQLYLYAAPVGDPALGPVAFPHRVSALELPQATLSHHLQDSTHIADEVVTAGIKRGIFALEASGFHGGEPDEYRWDIDHGAIDSWSARFTVAPTRNWSGQVSAGRLTHPEALEPGDIVRSTASVTYNRPLKKGHWATSLIWGRNHRTIQRRDLDSYLAESVWQFRENNYITGRVESVHKDELEIGPPGSVFRIAAYTLGYTRDFKLVPGLTTGLGGNFTLYGMPAALNPYYGARPAAFLLFLRSRP